MRTIAIVNQKGGCGKTTTTINLAARLARSDLRTLIVDLDPQSHCAAGLGVPEARIDQDISDALLAAPSRRIDPDRLLWRVARNLDLIPSRVRLAGLEAGRGGLSSAPDKEHRLAAVLGPLKPRFDVALVDCSPAIGLLTFNALAAASAVLIPVETGYFSMQGAVRQIATVRTVSRRLGVSVPIWIVPTLHHPANAVSRDVLEELRARFGTRVAPATIRYDDMLREAASFAIPVFEYAPDSAGASDYAALGDWVRAAVLPACDRPSDQPQAPAEADALLPSPDGEADPIEQPETPTPTEPPATPVVSSPEPTRANKPRPTPAPTPAPAPPLAPTPEEPPLFVTRPILSPFERARQALRDHSSSDPLASPEPAPAGAPAQRARELARRASLIARRPPTPEPAVLASLADAGSAHPTLTPVADPEPAPPPPSTRQVMGVTITPRGLLFVQPLTLGREVAVAGDFNGWSSTSHVMRRNLDAGAFELLLPVPPGRYRYRLFVDGAWRTDPFNPRTESNGLGALNNIADSLPPPSAPDSAPAD